MELLHEVTWAEAQVLNLKVVTGAKQAAVLEVEVPLTVEAKTGERWDEMRRWSLRA